MSQEKVGSNKKKSAKYPEEVKHRLSEGTFPTIGSTRQLDRVPLECEWVCVCVCVWVLVCEGVGGVGVKVETQA